MGQIVYLDNYFFSFFFLLLLLSIKNIFVTKNHNYSYKNQALATPTSPSTHLNYSNIVFFSSSNEEERNELSSEAFPLLAHLYTEKDF